MTNKKKKNWKNKNGIQNIKIMNNKNPKVYTLIVMNRNWFCYFY